MSRGSRVYLSQGVSCVKRCGWVHVRVYADREISQGWIELGTLPDGLRPDADLYFPAQISSLEARGYVSTAGRVAVYAFASHGKSSVMFTVAFPV